MSRKGKLAAILLVLTYAIPFVILAAGVGIDFSDRRVKPLLLVPAGFLIAALCALFVKPAIPSKSAKPEPTLSEDDNLAG